MRISGVSIVRRPALKQVGNLQAAFAVQELAIFAQDTWHVNSKLTFNYGFRYERQYNPSAVANNTPVLNAVADAATYPLFGRQIEPATIPDSQNEWGPRVGFAYDPMGDGKTVIRGYAGEYYAQTPLLIRGSVQQLPAKYSGRPSVQIGSPAFSIPAGGSFNQAAFELANPQYTAIVGGPGFAPNTVYRQFAILGINLNNFPLGTLPILTAAQLATIGSTIKFVYDADPSANFGIYTNANLVGITSNYKNPQSFQWGFGIQREVRKDIVIGVDWSQVNTSYLERYRDINLPAPSSVDATSGRVQYVRGNRPIPTLGSITLRDSSARSMYRGLTIRGNINKKHYRIDAFYTWSQSFSDDDNERDATGVLYDNPLNLSTEYWYSKLDRRHQFVANPLFFLPHDIEVSSGIRFRSGVPINATVGTDTINAGGNGDGNTNERPFMAFGVEYPRNFFRNRPLYDMDLRVQKGFRFGESKKLVISMEIFNLLNRSNMQFAGSGVTNFCRTTVDTPNQLPAVSLSRCGLDGATNVNFLNLYDQRQTLNSTVTANPLFGQLNLSNTPGAPVQQVQLGARFYW